MKIALVMEWSTSERNETVYRVLKEVAERNGHTVVNYGQFGPDDHRQTYNQNAVLISAILNSGAADMVVTGCGTGEGALLAANSMPGVLCGLVVDPADSYLYTQINGGNCISLPFAKGWGWAAEVNLEYVFDKLFAKKPGGGYPPAAAASEQNNARLLNKLKAVSHSDIITVLKSDEPEVHNMVKEAFAGKRMELFEADCKNSEILAAVKEAVSR